MHKNAAKVLIILLNPRKLSFVILFQKTKDRFLELARTFTGDDLDVFGLLFNGFAQDAVECVIDRAIAGKNGMEVEF